MRRVVLLGIVTFCAAAGPISRVKADQVWDTFGPNDSYNTTVGATISGATSPSGVYNVAYSFIPNETVTLDSINVALGLVSGHNSQTFVVEAADGPSGGPGVALDLIQVSDQAVELAPGVTSIITGTSTFHPKLVQGTQYWLVAEASGDTQAAFMNNDQGYTTTTFSQQQSQEVTLTGQQIGAFRINGTPTSPVLGPPSSTGGLSPVPEPTALVSMGLGLVGLALSGARRLIRRRPLAV